MKKSGSPLRIRLCAIVVLLCAVIAGIDLIMQGVDNIDYGTKTSKAAGQSQIIYGVAWLIGGVIVREIINGFSTIVAAHENREASEAPRAAVSKKPADAVSWICSRCRTENAGSRKVCEGCGWEKAAQSAAGRNQADAAPREKLSLWEQLRRAELTTWKCPECGKEQPRSVGRCEECGCVKPRQY